MSREGSNFEDVIGTPPPTVGKGASGRAPAARSERPRLIAASVLGAVVAAFALINLGDVKVHWLFATGRTPLIVVIAVAFILGMLVDRLVLRARRKRRS